MKITPIINNFLTRNYKPGKLGNNAFSKINFCGGDSFTNSNDLKDSEIKINYSYIDDIKDRNGAIRFGFDTPDASSLREVIRFSILEGTLEGDKLKEQKTKEVKENQETTEEKYALLQKPFETKTGQTAYPFMNFQEVADLNGVRGQTPLRNKTNAQKGMSYKFNLLKTCDIDTIIDLRSKNVCNRETIDFVENNNLNYYNFPVEEITGEPINNSSIEKIGEFFDVIDKGDFYIGCANGESRTDLAIGLNYVCNPKARNVPRLYWLHTGNKDMDLSRNIKKINKYITKNPELVKQWGWSDYEEYSKESEKRLKKVYQYNKIS